MKRLLAAGSPRLHVVLAGCGYDETPVPEGRRHERALVHRARAGTDLRRRRPRSAPTRPPASAGTGRPATRLDDGEDPQARATHRRRLGRHLPARARATRSPGKIEGFDIDSCARLAGRDLRQSATATQLRVITAADRIPLLQNGEVDIVVRNMTINCDALGEIAFSAEYYASGQKILVRRGSRHHRPRARSPASGSAPHRHDQPRQPAADWRRRPIAVGRRPTTPAAC